MSFACATEKWSTPGDTIGSDTNSAGVWVDQGQVLEIGHPRPVDGPAPTRARHMPSLSAMMEQVVRPTEPHSPIPIGELPPLVLEPNRRRVEPEEEEVEEPVSPILVASQKLGKVIRSLSLKREH